MSDLASRLSAALNAAVERLVALLMLLLVVDVWIGVVDRYLLHLQLPWPEVLARYLMIWAALLAISCGIARREHIGLSILLDRIPESLRRISLMAMDIVALALFLYVFWFGIGFALDGAKRQALIFGLSLGPAYAAIPVSAALAAIQLLLVLMRDLGGQRLVDQTEEAI
ncbi:C4-dicarboxylate ABC transporter permease [Paramesorhizobium deserti]|uniref:TRAP transporter small permease protein n=1 Tax=Paramesorhizobium deserti TaxID=1494590 RepID=A0A135HZ18_9HYPH|nr:TRAP transporter small permease subunit [Paramesorhizobium deserti]KXF78437.1 C4-dicarboxylate ABC transporter permease [Paramesorhizobium deserti]